MIRKLKGLTMLIAIALSFFFGLVAAVSLAVCARSGLRGISLARSISVELAALDKAAPKKQVRVRASAKASLPLRRSPVVCG